MRYSLQPSYTKYVQGYGFLSFAKRLGNRYGEKLISSAKKIYKSKYGKALKKEGLIFAKTSGKQIL